MYPLGKCPLAPSVTARWSGGRRIGGVDILMQPGRAETIRKECLPPPAYERSGQRLVDTCLAVSISTESTLDVDWGGGLDFTRLDPRESHEDCFHLK